MMDTPVISLSEENITKISGLLACGKVLILPASTVYGISCIIEDKGAVKRIYDIKKREETKPFIVLISATEQLDSLVVPPDATKKAFIKALWQKEEPDQVTLILDKLEDVPGSVTAGSDKIAVRMERDNDLRRIIAKTGPIVSTSATLSGSSAVPRSLEDIPLEIKQSVDAVIESTRELEGLPSTILGFRKNKPLLIREGVVKLLDILKRVKTD